MKILFVTSSIINKGGSERTLVDKANYFAECGHAVTFVTYEQGGEPYVYKLNPTIRRADLNIRMFSIYKYPVIIRPCVIQKVLRQFEKQWKDLLCCIDPDVIVSITYIDSFVMRSILKHKGGTPVIVEAHTPFDYYMISEKRSEQLKLKYYLRILKRCDLLICLTNSDAKRWQSYITNVEVVTNPVPHFHDQLESVCKEKGRIIAVGRLTRQKRHDRLIDAFSIIAGKYPMWHIDIFGGGEDKDVLEAQIERLGLKERIILHSPQDKIYLEYLKSQMFVLSSDYEGFPLVLLEAMACGLPVISTNCPYGPSDIIDDGLTGLLSKMDVVDLAEKMEWMIMHEYERNVIGENAHRKAAKYRKEVAMKEWEKAYLSVIYN